jgi:hypothetical protein
VTCTAILNAVAAGLLEPCVILDGNCREVCGYRPTESGRRYFGPEIELAHTAPLQSVACAIDKRDARGVQAARASLDHNRA